MPSPLNEKQAFAERLKMALKRSPKKVETPAELHVQFNLRYHGDPITPQSAQKWLSGVSRPTVDKIEVLAAWLGVSAQWLRYGIAEDRPDVAAGRKSTKKEVGSFQPTAEELTLLTRIRALSEHRRYLVTEIVEQLSLEQEMWRE